MTRELSAEDIDWLAREGCDFIGFESGATVAYDVAGYQRCPRAEVAPESLPARDGPAPAPSTTPAGASFAAGSYPVRVAGFRRNEMYGPDEIGALFQRHSIPWNDGLGNGLYESLRIDRKYGLKHVLEAPILGFDLPFLEAEWERFRREYPRHVTRLLGDLIELEPIYGGPLARGGERMIVLWVPEYPLGLFAQAYERNPQGVRALLQAQIGRPLPPLRTDSGEERAALTRFWSFIRRQQAAVPAYQARVLRQMMGPGLQVVANPHELPVLDMEGQAQAYDYPAVAIRPLLLEDELFLRHYIAYFTQFYRDLAGKPPMVSVRMNLSAASPQFIPGRHLIRTWYDQAVRHGAGAFYFWTRDYPTNSDPQTYDGPIPGNPVASTRPQERWDVSLELLGHLANHRRFNPPAAEVAILVPGDSALLHRREWRRIYAAFAACAESRIHSRFLSDRQIERSGVPQEVRVMVAPVLEFVSPALQQQLEAFAANGGALLLAEGALYDREGRRELTLDGAEAIDGDLFAFFAPEQPAQAAGLQRTAALLQEWVARSPASAQSWVFDVTCDSLPAADGSPLRDPRPHLRFAPWLYEHGSDWIMPYLR